jgi:hypothetical protein
MALRGTDLIIKTMDTTKNYNNPNANFFAPGQGGNPINPTPMVPSTIDASAVQSNGSLNLNPKAQTVIPDITGLVSTDATATPVAPTAPSTKASTLSDRLANLFTSSKNKETDLATSVDQATSQGNQQLNEINTQIKQLQAKSIQNQEAAMRSGETTGFASREQQNVARTDAIQGLLLSATAEGIRGNIALAETHATNAINAKYADINKQIEEAKTNIYNNYDTLTASEKKKADQTLLRIDAQDAFVKQKMEDEKSIQQMAIQLASYGVDNKTISEVQNATDFNTAIKLAGSKLQDPAQKLKLESLRLDNILTQSQIKKSNYELSLLQQYNGLSPKEYADKLKEEQKAIDTAKDEEEKTRLQAQALDKKVTLLGSVLDSSAIDSVVGPNALSRGATSVTGEFGRVLGGALAGGTAGAGVGFLAGGVGAIPGAIGGAIIGGITAGSQGAKDYFTGAPEKLVGQTEQFISKEFLQNLIDVKAQGATFGALQKAEQDALTASATYIGQRRVCDGPGGKCTEGSKVVGYDMSEADFRRELGTIKDLTQKAYERATGKLLSPEEQATLDKLYTNQVTDPSLYY